VTLLRQAVHFGVLQTAQLTCTYALLYPFTPLLNLHPLNFGLTPFGLLRSIRLTAYFYRNIFVYVFLINVRFSGTQRGRKTRPRCDHTQTGPVVQL